MGENLYSFYNNTLAYDDYADDSRNEFVDLSRALRDSEEKTTNSTTTIDPSSTTTIASNNTSNDTTPSTSTTAPTTSSTTTTTTTTTTVRPTTISPYLTTTTRHPIATNQELPYPLFIVAFVWLLLILIYLTCRWRQKSKSNYIIPRVFVLCSPRTVQYHYECILRVGLPSFDFMPEKHDIDITVLGRQRNEVVPMTRLNTNTLLDEPLITNLSIIVYRLVEMPMLGGLILKHSGPFKSWIYVYDFTVIDLATNREYYFAVNQYIGSLDRIITLKEPNEVSSSIQYPIDDVPLPSWLTEDIFLLLFSIITSIMFLISTMPINCSISDDIISIVLTSMIASGICIFLVWLLYYYIEWNQDRREYFNENRLINRSWFSNNYIRIILFVSISILGIILIYLTIFMTDFRNSLVWFLAVLNSCSVVIGCWNIARLAGIGNSIVSFGLKLHGIEMEPVGMSYSELARTKSGSGTSEGGGSNISTASNISRLGARSSVKSFGFNPSMALANRSGLSKVSNSLVSSTTGATPSNQTNLARVFGEAQKSSSDSDRRRRRILSRQLNSTTLSSLSSGPIRGKSVSFQQGSVSSMANDNNSEISEKRTRDRRQ